MLISGVSEGEARREGRDAAEYQTADELFELMAKDHSYEASENQPLSTRDLIILYKNIDVGTKLMSNANVRQDKSPNQHVETVVYKDDRESDDSDVSEIYSNEDLQEVFSINNERIDLINNLSSIQHPLCHKFGDIEFQSSNFSSEYDSHFLFKDPYIKQQLRNINLLPDSTEFDAILPASFLDYICCKRLEDNYNFYMDNIIRYVQHTIEQLKRISNGDYLTDRAREKWREVAKDLVIPRSEATKVLATSVSIPIHVMGKVDGHRSTWDDIVHSEVDIRSLSKILEKKIVIEVPKLICGSYKLFSERCADNLIISCKKELEHDVVQDKGESRVDVVFQLKPSGSGHVISNINSIMILQKIPSITTQELTGGQPEAFGNTKQTFEVRPKIIEINEQDYKEELIPAMIDTDKEDGILDINLKKSMSDTSDCSLPNNYCLSSSQSSIVDKGILNRKVTIKTLKAETDFTVISPDELRCAIRRLNMQTPVPEESEESSVSKKKSPTRVRIKSPYENQSYSIEEKKRRKLLEIREKREKKKMALSENCKVSKHKYGKGAVMAQPSSSVTKLSITNKSFYNSIYGENVNHSDGTSKKTRKSLKKDNYELGGSKDESENGLIKSSFTALDRNSFDDEATETIMQIQQKLDTEIYSAPVSVISNYSTDVNLLSQLIGASGTDVNSDDNTSRVREIYRERYVQEVHENDNDVRDPDKGLSSFILVPVNTPKEREPSSKPQEGVKKTTTSVECRKSIDKIYDLLKKIGKQDDNEICNSSTQHVSNTDNLNIGGRRSSTIQVSDSGTSVKHHVVSSNPSSFSFEKNNFSRQTSRDKRKKELPVTVVPKVIISTKLQTSKIDTEWNKTDRKRIVTSPSKGPDNPLKAISQLLHEFNNVQKTRYKAHKKDDYVLADSKTVSRQGSSKKPRQEPRSKDAGLAPLKYLPYKDRKPRPGQPPEPTQLPRQLTYVDDRHTGRLARRNLSDIIDEAKEARGEAVRGPSKPYSRLNTLAQPKKSYVQAHNDEYQNKYGRNIPANRPHRVTTSAPVENKNTVTVNNGKNKHKGPEAAPVSSPKPGIPAVPPLERIMRPRRSASNSPTRKRVPQPTIESSYKQITAPKSPDLKKKMVAVESYVKSHYGHMPIDTSELKGHEVHKSRVPLVPNDIELASLSSPIAEESTALGNQLHYMVDTMINTNVPALSVLTECHESTSKLSDGLEKLSTESLLKIDERKSESDYPVDIFEDKSILTAVGSISKDKTLEDKVVDENINNEVTYDVQPFNSATELRKLENALYQQMSVGAFPKRLRIKNLTLTPKQSLQQVIVVQSGDAGSLLVQSSLSQSLRSDSKIDSFTALKPLAALSNSHINWGFTNIPLQVATIGYAFPTFQSSARKTLSPYVQTLMNEKPNGDVRKDAYQSHKTSQCFKGVHTEPCLEQATQANIVVSITSTCNMNTSTEKKEKVNNALEITNNYDKIQPVTKICEIIRLITEKCDREQIIIERKTVEQLTEKCEKVELVTETSRTVQSIPELCVREQLLTDECEQVESKTKNCDKTKDMTESSVLSPINDKEISKNEAVKKPSEMIDHSTSLDILMGLLNEIRKITGEALIKNGDDNEHRHINQSNELEVILNNAATQESSVDNNCRDLVSIPSFEKLNQFNSNPSVYSFNILERDRREIFSENKGFNEIKKEFAADFYKSNNVDKEVSVDIEKEYMNKLTDAPSCLFSFTTNHGTNISDSVNEILSKPSTLSLYSMAKYEPLNCNSSTGIASQSNVDYTNIVSTVDIKSENRQYDLDKKDKKIYREKPVKVEAVALVNSYKCASKIITSTACITIGSTFDPVMKIKRDVLVTVYSILVFTVFAALSFPKLFFHVEM